MGLLAEELPEEGLLADEPARLDVVSYSVYLSEEAFLAAGLSDAGRLTEDLSEEGRLVEGLAAESLLSLEFFPFFVAILSPLVIRMYTNMHSY